MAALDNLNLSAAPRIDPQLSADDWKLYDVPGREKVAVTFNQKLADLVNGGATRNQASGEMCNVMLRYGATCAADSMPVLNTLLTAAYGF